MECCLKLYRWEDAPEPYRALSEHGGDEDWVLVAPSDVLADAMAWPSLWWALFDEDFAGHPYVPGFGHADVHRLPEALVVIFAHA